MTKYWYERNPALLEAEKSSLETFKREYNHPLFTYACRFRRTPYLSPDDPSCDGKFEVRVELPFRPGDGCPLELWVFQFLYDDNHPKQVFNGLYGGSIKAYPIRRKLEVRPGIFKEIPFDRNFHHLVKENDYSDRLYACQRRDANTSEVNAYHVLQNLTRWLAVYFVYETIGEDADA